MRIVAILIAYLGWQNFLHTSNVFKNLQKSFEGVGTKGLIPELEKKVSAVRFQEALKPVTLEQSVMQNVLREGGDDLLKNINSHMGTNLSSQELEKALVNNADNILERAVGTTERQQFAKILADDTAALNAFKNTLIENPGVLFRGNTGRVVLQDVAHVEKEFGSAFAQKISTASQKIGTQFEDDLARLLKVEKSKFTPLSISIPQIKEELVLGKELSGVVAQDAKAVVNKVDNLASTIEKELAPVKAQSSEALLNKIEKVHKELEVVKQEVNQVADNIGNNVQKLEAEASKVQQTIENKVNKVAESSTVNEIKESANALAQSEENLINTTNKIEELNVTTKEIQFKQRRAARKAKETEIKSLENQIKVKKSANAPKNEIEGLVQKQAEAESALLGLKSEEEAIIAELEALGKTPLIVKVEKRLGSFAELLNPLNFTYGTLSSALMGIGFAIPSIAQSFIEQMMQVKTLWHTIAAPQKFGDIWMQIPRTLLSEIGGPVVYFPLYIGLMRDIHSQATERDDSADLNEYILQAPLFIARDDWDNYGKEAIPNANFSGKMVELRTGAHLLGSGILSPDNQVIQLIGDMKNSKIAPLNQKVADFVDDVEHGVAREEYLEFQDQKASYPGNPALADLLNEQKNALLAKEKYPDLSTKELYPAIFNNTINTLDNPMRVGNFVLKGFKAIPSQILQKIVSGKKIEPVEQKPYAAMGYYVYGVENSRTIQAVKKLEKDAEVAAQLVEYMVPLNDAKQPVPLMLPLPLPPYNFPTLQSNPDIAGMLSLFDGTLYMIKDQKAQPSGIDTQAFTQNYFGILAEQIQTVHAYVAEKVQYGPFAIGDKTLVIDRELAQKNIFVYEVPHGLENGDSDYVVVTKGMQLTALPGSFDFIISLVTSRIYDSNFVFHDKTHGYSDYNYAIYKEDENKPPRVILGTISTQYGKPITKTMTAPLSTLFVDMDINPNTVPFDAIISEDDRAWLEAYVGGGQKVRWPIQLPIPVQWALSDRGPINGGATKAQQERIGQVIARNAGALKNKITVTHEQWKNYIRKIGTLSAAQAPHESYIWVFGIRPIIIRPVVFNGSLEKGYVYTCDEYPGEYFIFSNSKDVIRAIEFDPINIPRYAIGLSTGIIYDQQKSGSEIGMVPNMSLFIASVLEQQGAFLSKPFVAFLNSLQQKKDVDTTKQYITFGPFELFIMRDDLARGNYIYLDVTNNKNKNLNESALLDSVKGIFVGMELSDDGKAPIYGNKISEKTEAILNVINGILYTRSGTVRGYFKDYMLNNKDLGLDIQKGFLDNIIKEIEKTWRLSGAKNFVLREAIKKKIVALTDSRHKTLLAEKSELETVIKQERLTDTPLDQNTRKNIDVQKPVESLMHLVPSKELKYVGGKYYLIGYGPGASEKGDVVSYTDLNTGDANRDNGIGTIYDNTGKPLVTITGRPLFALRASLGIKVEANGQQRLNIPVQESAVSVQQMKPLHGDTDIIAQEITKQVALKKKETNTTTIASINNTLRMLHKMYVSSRAVGIDSPFSFYYNPTVDMYFAYMEYKGEKVYVDMLSGNVYNDVGLPLIAKFKVYSDGNAYMFIAQTKKSVVSYISFDGKSVYTFNKKLVSELQLSQAYKVTVEEYYNPTVGTLSVKYDEQNDTYTVTMQDTESDFQNEQNMYTFKHEDLYYTALQYVRSGREGSMTYNTRDQAAHNQLIIIWDGKPDLFVQKVIINNVSYDAVDKSLTDAESTMRKQLMVVPKKEQYPDGIEGAFVRAVIKDRMYDFLPIIEYPKPSAKGCIPNPPATDIRALKECVWHMNVITDTYGCNKLVRAIKGPLRGLRPNEKMHILQQAPYDRKNIIETQLKNIMRVEKENIYLYQLTTQDYQLIKQPGVFKDGYVNLLDGVIYVHNKENNTYFPINALRQSSLLLILNNLEIAVSPIIESSGDYLFDINGMPLVNSATGLQAIGNYGLIYRGKAFVEQELKNIDARFQLAP